ncbi:hypothetical protein D3C80_1863280 [compost metagenome]
MANNAIKQLLLIDRTRQSLYKLVSFLQIFFILLHVTNCLLKRLLLGLKLILLSDQFLVLCQQLLFLRLNLANHALEGSCQLAQLILSVG